MQNLLSFSNSALYPSLEMMVSFSAFASVDFASKATIQLSRSVELLAWNAYL